MTTVFWLGLAAWVLFIAGVGVALVCAYKSGHASGRAQERDRRIARERALITQVDNLRLQAPPPSPWVQPPPARAIGRPRTIPGPPRPQPNPRPSGVADTRIHDAARTTGGMRALTDEICARIVDGTWPPRGKALL